MYDARRIDSAPVDTREAARRWAGVWERGWREHDADAIRALYADGAVWRQHPFREPDPDYIARVFDEEESAQCEFGTPIVDGDLAAVPWEGQTKLVDGSAEDLVGVSLLRFDHEGLVIEQRDIWVGR
jgi:SnoaL-like domain